MSDPGLALPGIEVHQITSITLCIPMLLLLSRGLGHDSNSSSIRGGEIGRARQRRRRRWTPRIDVCGELRTHPHTADSDSPSVTLVCHARSTMDHQRRRKRIIRTLWDPRPRSLLSEVPARQTSSAYDNELCRDIDTIKSTKGFFFGEVPSRQWSSNRCGPSTSEAKQ